MRYILRRTLYPGTTYFLNDLCGLISTVAKCKQTLQVKAVQEDTIKALNCIVRYGTRFITHVLKNRTQRTHKQSMGFTLFIS